MDIEEGEIKVIDDDNYILSDSYFQFKFEKDREINWRNISVMSFHPITGMPNWTDDPSRDILMNLEDVAFTDLSKERNTRFISSEGRQASKILQFGIQYYIFA